MVIEIDEKCIELLDENKYIIFFNGLAHSLNNGRNYIFLSKRLLEKLYKSEKIDNTSRQIYKKIFDNSSQDLAIRNSVNRIITIINNKELQIKRSHNKILVPIDTAIEINLFDNKSNLLCENLSDCKFFYKIGTVYKMMNSINAINIELENVNGGGDTIADVYREKAELREISLILTDSDQKYLGDAVGSTLKNLLKEERKHKNNTNEIYALYVHEIENLIPIKMIENYYGQAREESKRDSVIKFLKLIDISNFNSSPLAFFDMKNGIEIKKWKEYEAYKMYWKEILDSIQYKYDENVSILDGFGPHLLRKINAFFDREIDNANFIKENMDNYLIDIWRDIGWLVYSYGCARPKNYFF